MILIVYNRLTHGGRDPAVASISLYCEWMTPHSRPPLVDDRAQGSDPRQFGQQRWRAMGGSIGGARICRMVVVLGLRDSRYRSTAAWMAEAAMGGGSISDDDGGSGGSVVDLLVSCIGWLSPTTVRFSSLCSNTMLKGRRKEH